MPRPKASEPTVNFTLALPVSLRETFTKRAAAHGEVPTLLLRKLIREWMRRHPAPEYASAPANEVYDDI